MGAGRHGSALDTAEAASHTHLAGPGHTIGLPGLPIRPEVTSTFSVGKGNPSDPGIENRRNLYTVLHRAAAPGVADATEAVTDGREER